MTEASAAHDKRAEYVALLGFVLQTAAFGGVVAISIRSDSHALGALARFIVAGIPIWFVLYLVVHQMRRVAVERLETAELQKARETGNRETLFGMDEEALFIEQNRLKWMVRWLLPACTIIVAALLLVGHFVAWDWSLNNVFEKGVLSRTKEPMVWMWFIVGVGFVFFLYARYTMGLARLPRWGPLRAGAVFAVGNALGCLAIAIALATSRTIEWAEPLSAYLLRVVLILLGLDFAVNFILDIYRPRVTGEVPRPSFDSRLLGMIGEPGGIAKSIADAVNYQFGFQVSSTWFYQLLQRWLFPITVFAGLIVWLLTTVVIVDADEQAVIERLGAHITEPPEVLTPGIHFKLPYPIDMVYRAPVQRISELVIGEASQEDADHLHEAVLWTEKHEFVPELMLLVASPELGTLSAGHEAAPGDTGGRQGEESVAASLLMASVPIEYRIKGINEYLYGRGDRANAYQDPEKLLEVVAYQHLSDYAASVDIDELMGPGRASFNTELKKMIQRRLDELGVGIEIAFVGLRGAHPPEANKVAETFQSVVSAQIDGAALVRAAEGRARIILTSVAGTASRADALDEAILRRDALPPDSPDYAEVTRRIDELLMGNPAKGLAPISGKAAAMIADARTRASRSVTAVSTKARLYGTELAAYTAAPELYRQRMSLSVYEEGLEFVRKYLIIGDASNLIIEYDTAKEAGLDQVLSEGVEKERKAQGSLP